MPFRVVCWNVGLQGTQLVRSWDGGPLRSRLTDMASVVKATAADIIFFQEPAPTHCCVTEFVLIF